MEWTVVEEMASIHCWTRSLLSSRWWCGSAFSSFHTHTHSHTLIRRRKWERERQYEIRWQTKRTINSEDITAVFRNNCVDCRSSAATEHRFANKRRSMRDQVQRSGWGSDVSLRPVPAAAILENGVMHLDSLSREIDERSLVFFFKWNSRETRYLGSTTSLRQVMNVHWIFFQMEFDRNEVSRFHYFSTPNDERLLDFFFKWNSREARYLGSTTTFLYAIATP